MSKNEIKFPILINLKLKIKKDLNFWDKKLWFLMYSLIIITIMQPIIYNNNNNHNNNYKKIFIIKMYEWKNICPKTSAFRIKKISTIWIKIIHYPKVFIIYYIFYSQFFI